VSEQNKCIQKSDIFCFIKEKWKDGEGKELRLDHYYTSETSPLTQGLNYRSVWLLRCAVLQMSLIFIYTFVC